MFEIMFTIYVLYSPSHNKIYIGFTSNIEQRMLSHNQLATKGYTVKFRPWTLIHTEVFETKSEAMRSEKELKSANGRQFIWNLIENKSI
jgi:putative endonuclease